MDTPSKKRRVISLDVKTQIIEASAKKNLTDLSKQFGLSVSTVQGILKNKTSILSSFDEGGDAKKVHLKPVKSENLEKAVLQGFKDARSQNEKISGETLKTKTMDLAKLLGVEAFKASNGWLDGFKHRNSIVVKGNQGEAAEIDMVTLGDWQQTVLRDLSLCDLTMTSSTLTRPVCSGNSCLTELWLSRVSEWCTSGKKSKERITVLVGSNMSGTEKLPLLVIGKSSKPHAFKNKEVPLDYKANRKAWMTGDFFEEWLKNWDRKLKRDGRKVLLFLDNFSGHSKIQLVLITIKFLPPNTTAASQPMDQDIIQNLKVHYRRFLLRQRIATFDAKTSFKMDLLKALQFLRRSWSDVKPETVTNCFRKAVFVKELEAAEGTVEEQSNAEVFDCLLNVLLLKKLDLA